MVALRFVGIFLFGFCSSLRIAHATSVVDPPGLIFESGQITLSSLHLPRLRELTELLKRYPQLRIFVAGHADTSEGSEIERQKISEQRASVAYDWLASQGVSAQLIGHKGFGKSKPLDSSQTEEQRQHNRCVLFETEPEQ